MGKEEEGRGAKNAHVLIRCSRVFIACSGTGSGRPNTPNTPNTLSKHGVGGWQGVNEQNVNENERPNGLFVMDA